MLFAQSVEDPVAWGLPAEAKQKVVWLCGGCAQSFDLEFEPATRHVILYLRRPRARVMAA
jgi:hypothetical protein